MIYLDNKTLLQELYIPRQEYISVTTGSGGTYAEGYADGVNDQKAKLASTAFTENGDYQRNDGWSAITVNVPQSGSVLEGKEIVVSQDVTIVVPTSGYDGFSAVTVDATEYGQTNYDLGYSEGENDGYISGVTDGEQSVIDTFTSTTITENGQYGSSANPLSSITVNVDTASTYQSGYTSGETHQKSLLGTTAFTINGSYSAENGYSAITVNVPTGETYNIEQNKPFTATSNGNYTITPSSGITTVTDRFDSDTDRYYITATTSGYPLSGRYNIFYIEDEFDSSKGQIDVYIENGYLDYDDSDWYGGEIVDLSVSREIDLFIRNANRHFEWYPLEDFDYHYDAMSAVSLTVNVDTATTYSSGYTDGENHIISTFTAATATTNGVYGSSASPLSSITVNVPQSGSTEKDIVICTSGGCWFNTNYDLVFGDSIEIEHCTFGTPILPYPGTHQQYVGGNSSEVFRIGQNEYGLYLKYFSNFNSGGHIIYFPSSGSILEDNTITFSNTGFTVDGNVVTSYTTTEISSIATLIFFANNSSGGDVVEKQTAKMGRVKVYASDGTLKATFEPRLDNLNVPYFKYVEQDIDIYASGSGTPSFEILDPYFYSGYTIGYNSGYTDGSAYIASLIDRSITEIVIPSGTTKIGNNAFYQCLVLSSVTIPNSVTSIGDSSFQSCPSLSSVTIPNSVTSIGIYCFSGCSSLSSITIPNLIKALPGSCFQNCNALTEVNIGSGITSIGTSVFRNCGALTNINISATTAPTIYGTTFQSVSSTGTVHYPQGSDYSSWQSNTYLSGWTFVADL